MTLVTSLMKTRLRRIFLAYFLLSSLLPLLLIICIVFQFIEPVLFPAQASSLTGVFTNSLGAIFLVQLLSFFIMFRWVRAMEGLTERICHRPASKPGEKEDMVNENEIEAIHNAFRCLYDDLDDLPAPVDEPGPGGAGNPSGGLEITDGLTTLFNRRHFDERLTEEAARADRGHHDLALILMDVDGFREYLVKNGQKQGDRLLEGLGLLLHRSFRKSEIPFRYGPDQFAALLPEYSLERAKNRAAQTIETVRSHLHENVDGLRKGKVTICCGVASYVRGEQDFVQEAETALHKAKLIGRGQFSTSGE